MHKNRRTLVIVDDDQNFCATLRDYLSSENLEVFTLHSASECRRFCTEKKVDIALLDQKLPDGEGHTLCPVILGGNEQAKIIFTTAFPSFDNAVEAIRAGAYDYLSKPFELEELSLSLARAIRTLDLENIEQLQNYKTEKEAEENPFIGGEGCLKEINRMMDLAASADAPVLITGETGTGKNVAARAVHYRGAGRQAPFVGVNCAALPENLIEAELFGYEKGAFTGAVSARKGIFEMAEGGTLFLDEIGDMPPHLQSRLLGVLDDKIIRRIGGETTRKVDVRIIAATSINLEEAITLKSFRQDLYYRLSVIKIHIPPLRERLSDIPALCSSLIKKCAGNRQVSIADSQYIPLMNYSWPGNVRELRNIIERALILQQGPEIRPSELITQSADQRDNRSLPLPEDPSGAAQTLSMDQVERKHIMMALEKFSGNHTKTAQALGISLSTLKRKIKGFGIT